MIDPTPAHGRYALRPATEEDLGFLAQLRIDTLKPYIEQTYGEWDEAIHQHIVRSLIDGGQIVLADDRPAGLLKLRLDAPWLELAEIELRPEHQNRGLGTRILTDVLAFADAHGYHTELRVFACSPAARLYERMGFRDTHRRMHRPPGGANPSA